MAIILGVLAIPTASFANTVGLEALRVIGRPGEDVATIVTLTGFLPESTPLPATTTVVVASDYRFKDITYLPASASANRKPEFTTEESGDTVTYTVELVDSSVFAIGFEIDQSIYDPTQMQGVPIAGLEAIAPSDLKAMVIGLVAPGDYVGEGKEVIFLGEDEEGSRFYGMEFVDVKKGTIEFAQVAFVSPETVAENRGQAPAESPWFENLSQTWGSKTVVVLMISVGILALSIIAVIVLVFRGKRNKSSRV
jgi:hypothetical protein